jgi:hypothetical protein
MVRQNGQQDLGGGAHDTAGRNVAAKYAALRIRDRDVEVGAVGGKRSRQGEYLQVATQFGRLLRSGKAQLRHAQAADALQDEGGADGTLGQSRFEGGPQVLSGEQTEGGIVPLSGLEDC